MSVARHQRFDVWLRGAEVDIDNLYTESDFTEAAFSLSHYHFIGDTSRGFQPLGYDAEDVRADLIIQRLEPALKRKPPRQREKIEAIIRAHCFWRPKYARGKGDWYIPEPSDRILDARMDAGKRIRQHADPKVWQNANRKRHNEAVRRILAARQELLKATGREPSLRALAAAAKAHINTVKAALLLAGDSGGIIRGGIDPACARIEPSRKEHQVEEARFWFQKKREARALARRSLSDKLRQAKEPGQNPDTGELTSMAKAPAAAKKPAKESHNDHKAKAAPAGKDKQKAALESHNDHTSEVAWSEPFDVNLVVDTTAPPLDLPPRLQIVHKNPDDLIGFARNARTHSPEQIAAIAASITEFGFNNPVLIDEQGGIIAGHARVLSAKQIGLETVPCIVLAHLTDIQKRAYLLADNKLYEMGSSWDKALLALEFPELEAAGFDLQDLGFALPEIDEIKGLTEQLPPADLTDPDAVPAPPKTPITKRGDVWICGDHRVMCGDASSVDDLDKLMPNEQLLLWLVDPPYGVKFEQGKYCATAGKKFRGQQIANDELQGDALTEFIAGAVSAAATKCTAAAVYVWSPPLLEGYAIAKGLIAGGVKIQSQIIWAKNTFVLGRCDYHWQHEACWYGGLGEGRPWYGGRDKGSVWNVNKMQAMELHPTQKPVELAEIAITNSTQEGDIVLDSFAGSGFVLIAAQKLNRRARCMDIDPIHVDTMVKRWQDFTGGEAHLEDGNTFDELKTAFGG